MPGSDDDGSEEGPHRRLASQDISRDKQDKPPTPSTSSSWSQTLWSRLLAERPTCILMLKGALPPTVSISLYQWTAFARVFSTLGYLVAIISILSFAILPRAKFMQNIFLDLLSVCIGAALILLMIYCSTQARLHTTPTVSPSANGPSPGTKVSTYNSSASAVSAIWLIFNIWLSNTLRASRPQLQFPVILYSIMSNVAAIYSPNFPNMSSGIAFTKRLLEAFLAGMGISTVISLLVFPITCRHIFFAQSGAFAASIKATLAAQAAYMESLEREDMFDLRSSKEDASAEKAHHLLNHHHHRKIHDDGRSLVDVKTERLKAAVQAMSELLGKMNQDITFAKREFAYGKLDASDIDSLFKLFRNIMLPLTGIASAAEIFERMARDQGWVQSAQSVDGSSPTSNPGVEAKVKSEKREWNKIMSMLHQPFQVMSAAMNDGLDHSMHVLELKKPLKSSKGRGVVPKTQDDVEAGILKPGDSGFAEQLSTKIRDFYEARKSSLGEWCYSKGLRLQGTSFANNPDEFPTANVTDYPFFKDPETHKRNQHQLFLILEMEHLLWKTGQAVLALVDFADAKAKNGSMKHKRFIVPSARRCKKWAKALFAVEDADTDISPDSAGDGNTGIYLGTSFGAQLDPEHLPPANSLQRATDKLRSIGRFLGGRESAFGFRVACATMSIAIVAFLADTQTFFLQQRLLWAEIMVSIGMTLTAGSGIFGFLGRTAGTVFAMIASFIIWYIVNGKTPGVIVFLFIFTFFEFYMIIKVPRLTIIGVILSVSQVLIVGYELQVRKVGLQQATSNGQPFYPIYLLAPYRLACVAGGMAVAFIWTFIPYPITERSQLRSDLGASLHLLANFYSLVHTTVSSRLRGYEGDITKKTSPGYRLQKAQTSVYAKELVLLAGLKQHSAFTAWEPTFGGRFPKETYDALIAAVQRILNYLALISYASASFSHDPATEPEKAGWIRDFARLLGKLDATSHEITSVLALCAASVANGTPLPPYLKAPEPYRLSAKLEQLDPTILSVTHILEPGYSAFAVMQIASSLVSDDIGRLIENVKALVGETDFAFHIHPSSMSQEAFFNEQQNLDDKGKKD